MNESDKKLVEEHRTDFLESGKKAFTERNPFIAAESADELLEDLLDLFVSLDIPLDILVKPKKLEAWFMQNEDVQKWTKKWIKNRS